MIKEKIEYRESNHTPSKINVNSIIIIGQHSVTLNLILLILQNQICYLDSYLSIVRGGSIDIIYSK